MQRFLRRTLTDSISDPELDLRRSSKSAEKFSLALLCNINDNNFRSTEAPIILSLTSVKSYFSSYSESSESSEIFFSNSPLHYFSHLTKYFEEKSFFQFLTEV